MATSNKKYGLVIPKKTAKGSALVKTANKSVFGDDSDEEEFSKTSGSGAVQRETTASTKIKKQTQLEIDRALLQDPTVYEYDAVYEDIKAEKVKTDLKQKNKQERQPKYITGLLKMAEQRKREEERRTERKVQKEREAEGNQFADKEAFVTSAYKKKMIEQQEADERERKEAALEAILDVTKQKDLSGFYRYLYRETAGKDTVITEDKPDKKLKIKKEPKSDEESVESSDSSVHREQSKQPTSRKGRKQDVHRDKERSDYSRGEKTRNSRSRSQSPIKTESTSTYESRSQDRMKKSYSKSQPRSKSRSPQEKRSMQGKQSQSQDRRRRRSMSPENTQLRSKDGQAGRSHAREDEKVERRNEEKSSTSSRKRLNKDTNSDEESEQPAKPSLEDLDRDDSLSESESSEEEKVKETEDTAGMLETRQSGSGKNGKVQASQNDQSPEIKEERIQLKYARHTSDDAVSDARKRFLARKLAKERARLTKPE